MALADFGYPAARLGEEAADVEAVTEADSAQEIAKAEAQQSTVERDETVGAKAPGRRKLAVKVVDVFGSDTMTIVEVTV